MFERRSIVRYQAIRFFKNEFEDDIKLIFKIYTLSISKKRKTIKKSRKIVASNSISVTSSIVAFTVESTLQLVAFLLESIDQSENAKIITQNNLAFSNILVVKSTLNVKANDYIKNFDSDITNFIESDITLKYKIDVLTNRNNIYTKKLDSDVANIVKLNIAFRAFLLSNIKRQISRSHTIFVLALTNEEETSMRTIIRIRFCERF